MSIGDFYYAFGPRSVSKYQTKAGQTAIKAGEPVIQDTSGDAEYVQSPGANVTTSDTFVGFAVTADTVTAAVDGVVYVDVPSAGTTYKGYAKTAANLTSSNMLTKVVIDFTTPRYRVDESTTSAGFLLMESFDATTGEVWFKIDMTEAINA